MTENLLTLQNMINKLRAQAVIFQGYIGKSGISALLDSGSTHSFVDPVTLRGLQCKITKTNPMIVMVANGDKMISDSVCESLKYTLEGMEFCDDIRILSVKGHNLILGMDWLNKRGEMKIDWPKKSIEFTQEGKNVKLQAHTNTSAEVKLMDSEIILQQELQKGHEVIFAQIYYVKPVKTEMKMIKNEIKV